MSAKHKYIPFSLVAVFFLAGLQVRAQEEPFETDTVRVNTGWETHVNLSSISSAEGVSPENFINFFRMKRVGNSILIRVQQANTPTGIINVKEPRGIRSIVVLYKKEVGPDDNFVFDLAGATASAVVVTNIVLPLMSESEMRKDLAMQKDPIPYNGADGVSLLKSKYPEVVDFNIPPPDQPINLIGTQQNPAICEELMAKNDLNLAYGKNDIPVSFICKTLVINGPDAYLKILIQNNGSDEFLTGTMIMTWVNKSGVPLKLYPGYFCPGYLPVVQPGKQIAIIYPFKAFAIADEDTLKFEIHDRLKTINVEFAIPGKVYNGARNN